MHELAPIIQDLAIILCVASLVTLLFQYIHQPVILGYLIAGIIVGPHVLQPYALVTDIANIKVIAELGVIFVMFSLGLEFSFHKLARVGFSAGVTGVIEVTLMVGLGFATGQLLGWSFFDSIFLGAAISISSTTIIIKSLEELRLKGKRFAELIFGLLIVEDLLAVLLLVGLSTLVATKNVFSFAIVWSAAKLIVVVGSWFVIGYFIVPYFFRRVIKHANQETLTIVSIAFCLFLVSIAVYFHYSPALGAFIMGSIIAETPQVHRIEELIRPIRDIFAAVFFVSVGMLIDPYVIIADLPVVLLISGVMIFGKIVAPSLGSLLTGQSFSNSLRVGFGMAQIGEFSFIIAALGTALNVTSHVLYPTIVAVAVISTFTGPYLIRLSGQLVNQLEQRLSPKTKKMLENYSTWVYRSLADKKDRSSYRKVMVRFVLNAIVVAVIFTLTDEYLSPYIDLLINTSWLAELTSWLIALTLSSPFLWAMLFSLKLGAVSLQSNRNSLLFFVSIIWIMSIGEVGFFSLAYFHTWVILVIFLVAALVLLGLLYSRLEKFYQWFEKHFLANLRPLEETKDNQLKKLAPWESHLASIVVARNSPYANKTLEECQIREQMGVNIVAIVRDGDLLRAPRGNHQLLAHDKLIVLGTDEQIDSFRKIVETPLPQHEEAYELENFILKAVLLEHDSLFIDKSIRDSKIRESVDGLVVGLERDGKQILNPDPATILQVGDLVLMVGEAWRLRAIA